MELAWENGGIHVRHYSTSRTQWSTADSLHGPNKLKITSRFNTNPDYGRRVHDCFKDLRIFYPKDGSDQINIRIASSGHRNGSRKDSGRPSFVAWKHYLQQQQPLSSCPCARSTGEDEFPGSNTDKKQLAVIRNFMDKPSWDGASHFSVTEGRNQKDRNEKISSVKSDDKKTKFFGQGSLDHDTFAKRDMMPSPGLGNPRTLRQLDSAPSPAGRSQETPLQAERDVGKPSVHMLTELTTHRPETDQAAYRAAAMKESSTPGGSLGYRESTGVKGNPEDGKKSEPLSAAAASSSACSRGASNQPQYTFKRKHQETTDDESDSEDESRETQQQPKKRLPMRGYTGPRRIQTAEVRNLSEKRRRERINNRLRALQKLIPNCQKKDKASVLDMAIEYLRTLHFQLQILSVINMGLHTPPMMLTATAMQQHINAHQLAHCSTIVAAALTNHQLQQLAGLRTGTSAVLMGRGPLPSQVLPMLVPRPVVPFTNTMSLPNSPL